MFILSLQHDHLIQIELWLIEPNNNRVPANYWWKCKQVTWKQLKRFGQTEGQSAHYQGWSLSVHFGGWRKKASDAFNSAIKWKSVEGF